jgi:hypothetical protein
MYIGMNINEYLVNESLTWTINKVGVDCNI